MRVNVSLQVLFLSRRFLTGLHDSKHFIRCRNSEFRSSGYEDVHEYPREVVCEGGQNLTREEVEERSVSDAPYEVHVPYTTSAPLFAR